MRLYIFALSLALLLFTGCGGGGPKYEIHVGDQVHNFDQHDDEKLLREDIRKALKENWEKLDTKESPVFFYKRLEAWKSKSKEGAGGPYTSPKMRFFKKEGNIRGIEELQGDSPNTIFIGGKDLSWENIEDFLYQKILQFNES